MKRIIFPLIIVFCLFACNMEEIPKAQMSKEPVFNTEDGLRMYTNSFYNTFPNSTSLYTNSYYIAVNSVIKYFTEGGYSAEESSGWNWSTLRNINYFIANCNSELVSEEVRNNYLGVAHFFRAYFYFNMMQRFGDLPWIDSPLEVDDPLLTAGRDDRSLIAEKIKEDLDFAIEHIQNKRDETGSTITSTVAAAFKSRVCLWEGTFRKYHKEAELEDADQWLEEAVSAAEYVMEAGYSIYKGDAPESAYRQLFISNIPITSEVLYAVTFDRSLGITHSGNRRWTSTTFGSSASLTHSFVNTYLMQDGTPFTDQEGYDTMSFTEETKNRDMRLSQTIRTPGFTRIKDGVPVETSTNYSYAITGYQTSKFTLDDEYFDSVDDGDNNVILFRYAEVLLNYAEAKAELGILTDGDWRNTIGTLRDRAGITGGLDNKPQKADPYMQQHFFPEINDPALLEIRRERAIELSFEGFSWSDICRWKVGELVTKPWDGIYIPELDVSYDMNGDGKADVNFTKNLNPDKESGVFYLYVGETLENGATNNSQLGEDGHRLFFMKHQERTWDDKLYFYPIPAVDLVKNPNLEQNPGW